MKLNKEVISSGARRAILTTWGNKYNFVVPSIKKDGDLLYLSTSDLSVCINSFDEILLTIIIKFLFMPIWLIKDCYCFAGNLYEDIEQKIQDWINIGIIWKEDSVTGQYVRPTYALFQLFGLNPYPYVNIPFNTLTHTISEEKVVFDIMSGNSDIIKREKINIPRISELGFSPSNYGTNVISEVDFKNPKLYTEEGLKELELIENKINQGIANKEIITPELEDFRFFVLVKNTNNEKLNKKKYNFHIPDLVIPLPRENGKPKSIAIEIELTDKRYNYEETLLRYKDNNKFGVVYWLVASTNIANSIKLAYNKIGGTGSCRTVLSEFIIPYPKY